MASPERVVSTPSQIGAAKNFRDQVSKTAMHFAPVYEKRNSVFN